jgi:glutamine synthetase
MDTMQAIEVRYRELADELAGSGVRYILGAWADVLGRAKAKLVPIDHLPNMLAGSERYTPRGMGDLGQMNPNEDECVAMPDPDTLVILPWDSRVAMMNADLLYGGTEPWENCPRSILKAQLARAAAAGYRFNLGVETEFYVYRRAALPDLVPLCSVSRLHPTPCYEVESSLDSLPFLERLHRYMTAAGFRVFSIDQEGGDGQYEYDFEYDECLAMCDRITLFKLMLRQTAKEVDGVVTFMPKPQADQWGSGAHMNMSLDSIETGENAFRERIDGEFVWSKLAMQFLAGVLRHAPALAALTTPTVNSYKRLQGRLVDGNISWAPTFAAWGRNNRSCMMRVPDNRPALENRAVDPAANMYLSAALTLAAGLEGIELGLDPGCPVTEATYDWNPRARDQDGRRRLPRTLLEAIEEFDADPLVREVFSSTFVEEYVDMKHREWEGFFSQITPWELDRYFTNL